MGMRRCQPSAHVAIRPVADRQFVPMRIAIGLKADPGQRCILACAVARCLDQLDDPVALDRKADPGIENPHRDMPLRVRGDGSYDLRILIAFVFCFNSFHSIDA